MHQISGPKSHRYFKHLISVQNSYLSGNDLLKARLMSPKPPQKPLQARAVHLRVLHKTKKRKLFIP
ncbi:MAG: hypothetical protein CR217_07795 [Beijerinckiaceae bacterium]|nr:MAG: hypothetical protein CR217_07795 [Beijerinckiaceae bacterium]